MKKFVVKFLLVISLFFSTFSFAGKRHFVSIRSNSNANSGTIHSNNCRYWHKIVKTLVDIQLECFDVFELIERNIPNSIDSLVESIDILPLFVGDLRNQFIEKFNLNELSSRLNISLDDCVFSILKDCNDEIILRVLNNPNSGGVIPLQFALDRGYWIMAIELLENGADFFIENSFGGVSYPILLDKNIPIELLERFKLCVIKDLYEESISLREIKEILLEVFPFARKWSLSFLSRQLLIDTGSFN